MQIDWDKAPEWANYAAMDEDGEWWWFEQRPNINTYEEYWDRIFYSKRQQAEFIGDGEGWMSSLQERPFNIESPATLNSLDNDYFL